MPALREIEATMMAALLDDAVEPATSLLRECGHAAEDLIGVYRDNVREGFRKALALEFPVMEQLVGSGFFAQLARDYQRAHPSRSGDLQPIGTAFAEFLEARFGDGEYRYFADVARLEWLCETVALLPREQPAAAGALQVLADVDPAGIVLRPRRDLRLLRSCHPVASVWQLHQGGLPDSGDGIDLDAHEAVLVMRGTTGIELMRVGRGEAALLASLLADGRLVLAADAALDAEPEFELAAGIARLWQAGVFAAVHADTDTHSDEARNP